MDVRRHPCRLISQSRSGWLLGALGVASTQAVAGEGAALWGAWDWMLTPLSGAATHYIESWAAWHGRLMVVAWGVLLPLGVLVARFFKVTPRQEWPAELDNKFWWHTHRLLQYGGVLVMSLGVALAWREGRGASPGAQWHGWLGWLVFALGWLQVLGGYWRGSKGGPRDERTGALRPVHERRGDHYDMSFRRVAFERVHKTVGYAAMFAGAVVLVLGLIVADAPRWMAVILALWWAALTALFVRLQRQGRCLDTYQAIWGPDPEHPGNRRRPIGWGVWRYTAETYRCRFAEKRRT